MKIFLLFSFIVMTYISQAQTTIPLYEGPIPGAKPGPNNEKSDTATDGMVRVSKISVPTMIVYLPKKEKATGTAVIVFPGGGYGINAIKHEGWDVGRFLADNGIAAFVVKYRLPDSATMEDPSIGPLQDAQQAISLVRKNAKAYGVKTNKVGVMGFSAGGHLASTVSTHFRYAANPKAVRPDFSVLIYPVISFSDSIGHKGSRQNLIGKKPSPENILKFSNELQVYEKTPPAFLAHAKDDKAVIYNNSVVYAEALRKYNIPVELLLVEKGGHGFGLYNKQSDVQWPDRLLAWMKTIKM
jgi:acetyl esterase/lipase